LEVPGIQYEWIEFSTDIVSAKRMMKVKSYDAVLLDINLPQRADTLPDIDGGLEILRWLRATGRSHRPQHLIATTAYDNSEKIAKGEFDNIVWSLIPFSYDNDEWKIKIKEAFQHIIEALLPPYRNDGASYKVDLGIVVALEDVELKSILNLPGNWQRCSGPKPDSEISLHVGAVASGAAVLQSHEKMKELVDTHKDLRAIEMEIFATLCAAEYAADPKPQAFAVKAVCDFGDEQKGDSFQEYAAFVSAQVMYEFVISHL
jgi:CheY-like chemotaxis protein